MSMIEEQDNAARPSRPERFPRLRARLRRALAWWRATTTYAVLMRWSAPARRAYRRWTHTRSYRIVRRYGRIVLGLVLVAAGIAMLVLPGQGILTIIAGLAVMAPEVPLAERLMNRLKQRLWDAEDKVRAARANRRQAK